MPHWRSARSTVVDGTPDIPTVNALPIGVNQDIDTNPYLLPYKHFHDNLFEGLFDPTDPTALLERRQPGRRHRPDHGPRVRHHGGDRRDQQHPVHRPAGQRRRR